MSVHRYLFVLTRDELAPDLSAAALGALTGRSALWVAALRRWRLLDGVALSAPIDATSRLGRVRGCLLVTASDLDAARRVAATYPRDAGTTVAVLALGEEVMADRGR